MTEEISNLLIALIPSITGVLAIVGSVLTCIHKVKDLTDNNAEANKDLKNRLTQSIHNSINLSAQNEEFKKEITELQEKIANQVETDKTKIEEIVNQNAELLKQNEELIKITEELKKIKAQYKAIIKKGE